MITVIIDYDHKHAEIQCPFCFNACSIPPPDEMSVPLAPSLCAHVLKFDREFGIIVFENDAVTRKVAKVCDMKKQFGIINRTAKTFSGEATEGGRR